MAATVVWDSERHCYRLVDPDDPQPLDACPRMRWVPGEGEFGGQFEYEEVG